MHPTPLAAEILPPRHLGTWLGLALLRLMILLPWTWQMSLGDQLGRLLLILSRRRRAVARRNLEVCYPELDRLERGQLVSTHFRSLGRAVWETGLAWWASERRIARLGRVEGLEYLTRAREQGLPVLLLSGHFTSMELGARLLTHSAGISFSYRRARNPVLQRVSLRARSRRARDLVPRDSVRGMLRILRSGGTLWYAPDQDHKSGRIVFASFFGVPAATLTAPVRLSRISGAVVMPFFARRVDRHGVRYRVDIGPPLQGFPSGDDQADAERLNSLLEAQVRSCPEQYLWVHRRFKTRPGGEMSLYRSGGIASDVAS